MPSQQNIRKVKESCKLRIWSRQKEKMELEDKDQIPDSAEASPSVSKAEKPLKA